MHTRQQSDGGVLYVASPFCLMSRIRFVPGGVSSDVSEAHGGVVQPRARAVGSREQGGQEKDERGPVHRKVRGEHLNCVANCGNTIEG